MIKASKKIEATEKPLTPKDVNKIRLLLKTYETGEIEDYISVLGLTSQNMILNTYEEIEVLLISDSNDNLEKLEKEFELKLKESLGDKVRLLPSNIIN